MFRRITTKIFEVKWIIFVILGSIRREWSGWNSRSKGIFFFKFFQIDQNQWSLLTALKNCSCIAAGHLIMGVLSQSPVFLDKTRFKSFTISCTYLQGERGPQGDRGPPGAAVSIFFSP